MLSIFTVVMAAVFSCWATEGYDDLAKLLKAGVSEDVIIAFINSSNVRYALSPDTIVQLKAMGASDKVITAAIQRSGDLYCKCSERAWRVYAGENWLNLLMAI